MADYNIYNSRLSGNTVTEAVQAAVKVVAQLPNPSDVTLGNKLYICNNVLYRSTGSAWVALSSGETDSGVSSIGNVTGQIAIDNSNVNNVDGHININPDKLMTVQSIPYKIEMSSDNPTSSPNTSGGLIPIICRSTVPTSNMKSGYLYILAEEITT